MKKIICFLALVTLSGCGNEDKSEKVVSSLQDRRGLMYEINTETPFTGVLLEQYDSGQNKKREEYQDGKLNGSAKTWAENGELISDFTYSHGIIRYTKQHIAEHMYLPMKVLGSKLNTWEKEYSDANFALSEGNTALHYLINALEYFVTTNEESSSLKLNFPDLFPAIDEYITLLNGLDIEELSLVHSSYEEIIREDMEEALFLIAKLASVSSEPLTGQKLFDALMLGYKNRNNVLRN